MYSTQGPIYNRINNPDAIVDNLPAKVFTVQFNPLAQSFYLELAFDRFNLPSDLYSCNGIDSTRLSNLFVERYLNEPSNLGVLLSGLKGTGKSMLLKQTANLALDSGLPVLLVEQSFASSSLSKFLSSITENCVVLFDEFEKYYYDGSESPSNQNELLSFFDGTSISHKLIVMTVNDQQQLSQFFINRPSRIRYVVEYTGLSSEFVAEYLAKKLDDKSIVQAVIDEFDVIEEINFDLLNVCCDELNKSYPTLSIKEIFRFLNIQTAKETYVSYEAKFYIDGEFICEDMIYGFDFDDFNGSYGESVSPDQTVRLCEYLKTTYGIRSSGLVFNRNNTTPLKGRDLMTAKPAFAVYHMTDTKADKPELNFTVELKRVKFKSGAF